MKLFKPRPKKNGFTLTEVMIAGLIMTTTLTGVARMMTSSLAGSANLSAHRNIEAAVSNDIQQVQRLDTELTHHKLDLNEACINPASVLASHLESVGHELGDAVTRTITTDYDIVNVTYSFDSPTRGVGIEHRVVELNPTFSAHCYTTR